MKINKWRYLPFSMLLMIVVFIVWASKTSIDQIARATGQVIALSRTQVIQSANDGVIEKVYVTEGQKVKKGELLVLLVKSQADAAYKDSLAKVSALKATLARLHAEVYNKPLSFPPEVARYPEFIANQTELFHRRQTAMREEVSAMQESLKLAQEELTLNEPLLVKGDIGKSDVIKLQRQIADLKGQISKVKNKYFQDAQAEMTKAEEELTTKEQELADRTVTLQRTQILAPTDGFVKNIVLTTNGARVRPGDVVLEVVPTGDELIMEAKLNPADLTSIHKGLPATIKLDAYDYAVYGMIKGEVIYVSPDSLTEKTPQGEKAYFKVHIRMTSNELKNRQKIITIEPGMTGSVEIRTGERSVLTYLTKPVTKTFDSAFHEK